MSKEKWKDIGGYEGLYQVSNKGRIKSLKRMVNYRLNGFKKTINEKVRKQSETHGYKYITLSKNGINKQFRVHRLVAEAFIPNPYDKPEVNHKNGIKDDNRVKNLEWSTKSENERHAHKSSLKDFRGENSPYHKITRKEALEIIDRYSNTNVLQRELSEEYGISQSQVGRIINGKRWPHLTEEYHNRKSGKEAHEEVR